MAIDKNEYPVQVETGLWANKNHDIFFYNFKYENKKYRGLINLADKTGWGKKDRISYAKMELLSIKNSKRDSVLSDKITLDQFIEKFFSHMPDGKYKSIRKSHYERYVSPFCGSKKVVDIRQMHIKNSIQAQEAHGLAARTVKQTLEVLNPAFKSAIANRLISFNPCDGIKIKLPKTKKIVTAAKEKLKEIYKAIYDVYGDDPFYLSLFLFALQGRRRGEILTLKWEDVNMQESYYVLRNTKNNEEQKIFLPEIIKENLLKLPLINEWVFYSRISGGHIQDIRKATDKLKRVLNDDNFGIHYLRNVIVSAMAESGFASIHLSGALGHNDPNTINKYLTMNYLQSSEMASEVIEEIVKS